MKPDAPFARTRAQALARLAAFLPRAGRLYAANRNRDEGPGVRTHVSQLSPAIRRRLLTEEEVVAAALDAHGADAEKFVDEVCWRTYWRGWLEAHPAVWRQYLTDLDGLEDRLVLDSGLARCYAEAIAGRTGIDAFDAWARELVETGWLHNHARMNFASIWIFTLQLPWQLGAAHFYRHLLDACPASNTLSWRWVRGLQTRGKAYLARADIIRRSSGGRFCVDAPLATCAPEPAPEPRRAPRDLPPPDPFDSQAPFALFVHTEDCTPEAIAWPGPPRLILAVDAVGGDPAEPKRAIANAALDDAATRAAAHFGAPLVRLPEARVETALADALRDARLGQCLTAHAPVGPVADRLALIAEVLASHGIGFARVLRPWDRGAWPHATKGFFHFRRHWPPGATR